ESNRAYQTKSALLGGKKRVNRKVDPFLLKIFRANAPHWSASSDVPPHIAVAAQYHAGPVITAHK
ncbi:hypothetical protein, partial [Pseudomonas syringae]|uniref:hypothetical protein n=1 Tax=Pseudomonas syringae TaxID=317 RepID=UPI001C7FF1F8